VPIFLIQSPLKFPFSKAFLAQLLGHTTLIRGLLQVRKEDLVDQKLNCSFELPSTISSLGVLAAVAESPPIISRVPHRPEALTASPAVGGSNHSSGFDAAGESLHRSDFERSLEASTRYSELGDETSERDGASVRDPGAGGRDVEKELLEKLQLERRNAGARWITVTPSPGSHMLPGVWCADDVLPSRVWDRLVRAIVHAQELNLRAVRGVGLSWAWGGGVARHGDAAALQSGSPRSSWYPPAPLLARPR
jgi:hypothetical protein